MAGAIADGELTARASGRVRFEVADARHDAAIRSLLRESALQGDIVLTREREPSYFAGSNLAGVEDETIVAIEGGAVVGIASCSIRQRYVNGTPRRVGYLGELRLARAMQGRFDILRRGFQFYAARHRDNPADIYFTSIAADNKRSIRFLERRLPGMPRYEVLTDFVTLVISSRSREASLSAQRGEGLRVRGGDSDDVSLRMTRHDFSPLTPVRGEGDAQPYCGATDSLWASVLADCLNAHAAQYQFTAHWSSHELRGMERCGLQARDFQFVTADDGDAVGCAALWDQRAFKQTVVRGYSSRLRLFRPLANAVASWIGSVRLPPPGSTLAQAFLSPLAVAAAQREQLIALVQSGLHSAGQRGVEMVMLGFAANDPRLETVRRNFRCREYRTRLYRVRWSEMETRIDELDDRIIAPEVALL